MSEKVPEEYLYPSIMMNLGIDFNEVFPKVPKKFEIKESFNLIHFGTTNQVGFFIEDNLLKENYESPRIAVASFYFANSDNGKEMHIESVQGELRSGNLRLTRREINKFYGKLGANYDVNWRIGLAQEMHDYGISQGAVVKADIPDAFGTHMDSYPNYALNYLRTYLSTGIPLENISFDKISLRDELRIFEKDSIEEKDSINTVWDPVKQYLEPLSNEDRIATVSKAISKYAKAHAQNKELQSRDFLTYKGYLSKCGSDFKRIIRENFV